MPLAWLLWFGVAVPVEASDLATQRQQYREAREALRGGDAARFQALLTALDDYSLLPYLHIEAMQRGLRKADDEAVLALLMRYPDIPASEDLRRDWLRLLASRGDWSRYHAQYTPQRSVTLRCQQLRASIELGIPTPLDDSNRDLWLAGHSQPDACDPVFSYWRRSGQLDPSLFWRRGVAAIGAGELRLASWLAQSLDIRQQEDLQRWIELRQDPRTGLERARHWPDSAVNRRMLSEALWRMAGSDPESADRYWRALADRFEWDQQQRIDIPRRIALLHATDYPPDALAGLLALPDAAVDTQIREWRVRVALHQGDWRAALHELEGWSEADLRSDRWRYWHARSLEATGDREAARALFETVALEPNYYGFLAAERVGRPYVLCPRLRDPQMEALSRLNGMPGFLRAIELFHAEQYYDARREWGRALSGEDPELRRHAAVIADAEGWHERAILTLADAGFLTQYAMRFPLAYADRVSREAARQRLNPSLIYGVMRSESAMAPDAVSSAQARGLMQLTLATGRQVARAERLPAPRSRDLLDPDKNIRLGAAYLDQLFERFGHPLMVLAAYNAGPGPVERWQSEGMPTEADRWIETVPYHETRDYLSRVLAFATIYDWRRFGRMVPLSMRMPPMDAGKGKSDLDARPVIQPICPATESK